MADGCSHSRLLTANAQHVVEKHMAYCSANTIAGMTTRAYPTTPAKQLCALMIGLYAALHMSHAHGFITDEGGSQNTNKAEKSLYRLELPSPAAL